MKEGSHSFLCQEVWFFKNFLVPLFRYSYQCNFFKYNLIIALLFGFDSRSLNSSINRLHELCLRIIFNDKYLNLKELLNKDNSVSVSIHHKSIHAITIEVYKVGNGCRQK